MADTSVNFNVIDTDGSTVTTVYTENSADNIVSDSSSEEEESVQEVLDTLGTYSTEDTVDYDDLASIVSTTDDETEEGTLMSATQSYTIQSSIDESSNLAQEMQTVVDELEKHVTGLSDVYYTWTLTSGENTFIAKLHMNGLLTIDGTGDLNLTSETDNTSYWNDPELEITMVSAKLGEGITTAGDYLFTDCADLLNIDLPSTCTAIGAYFAHGTNLLSLEIPESVTSIGSYAFT